METSTKQETPIPVITNQSDGTGQLVRREETHQNALVSWETEIGDFRSNLSKVDPNLGPLLTKALATADKKTRDVVNVPLSVTHYIAHIAEMTDEKTGEINQALRCVLICEDGSTVSSMSNGVLKTIAMLARINNFQPWNPPIRVMIRSHNAKGGKSYCDMIQLPLTPVETRSTKR